MEIYGPHVFTALRPISLTGGDLVEAELFLIASERSLVTIRFSPVFDLANAIQETRKTAPSEKRFALYRGSSSTGAATVAQAKSAATGRRRCPAEFTTRG